MVKKGVTVQGHFFPEINTPLLKQLAVFYANSGKLPGKFVRTIPPRTNSQA